MTTTALPRSLSAWIKALDAVALPAFAGPHREVCQALRDSSLSMRQIAELIQVSPVLALNVIREANRNVGAASEPAESLEVALSRIGMLRAEPLLARNTAIETQEIPAHLSQHALISRTE